MAQVGLTDRLNRHSQQTGPLLGCSMAVVLFLCLGVGIILYQRLDEYRTDIFGVPTVVQSVPTVPVAGTPRGTREPARGPTMIAAQPTGAAAAAAPGTPGAEQTPAPPQTPTVAPTPTPAAPRFRITRTQGEILNMRAAANTQAQILARLAPNTVVEDAGESATGLAGAQQVQWRKVKGPGGQVGWVPEQYLERVEG